MKRLNLKTVLLIPLLLAVLLSGAVSCASINPAKPAADIGEFTIPPGAGQRGPAQDISSPASDSFGTTNIVIIPPAGQQPAEQPASQAEDNASQWLSDHPLGKATDAYFRSLWLIYGSHFNELTARQIEEIQKKQREAVNGMLALLDRYSRYHSPEEAEEIRSGGNFSGVGIQIGPADFKRKLEHYKNALKNAVPCLKDEDFKDLKMAEAIKVIAQLLSTRDRAFAALYRELVDGIVTDDGLAIEAVMPGSPAETAGVQNYLKWHIVKADGRLLCGMTFKDAINLVRGPTGSRVMLSLRSPDGSATKDIEVTRGSVGGCRLESRMITPEIGYIRLSNFEMMENGRFTADPFIRAVSDLKQGGMKKLVLDFRGNPGGNLHEAHQMLSAFLPAGKLEIYTMHRGQRSNELRSSALGQKFCSVPLVILVDEMSASASELVAIALQEHQRAVIIGTKTYGKGTVQRIYDMPDGGALRLTVEKYYSPIRDICVDEIGVTPDIEIKDNPDTSEDEVINKAKEVLSRR